MLPKEELANYRSWSTVCAVIHNGSRSADSANRSGDGLRRRSGEAAERLKKVDMAEAVERLLAAGWCLCSGRPSLWIIQMRQTRRRAVLGIRTQQNRGSDPASFKFSAVRDLEDQRDRLWERRTASRKATLISSEIAALRGNN